LCMTRNVVISRFVVVMMVIASIGSVPGCLVVESDDPDSYISDVYLIPTELNGTLYWEAQYILVMFKAYDGYARWKDLRVSLVGRGDTRIEIESGVTQDSGNLTEYPTVFYVDRRGPSDMLTRNDFIRITGIGAEMLPIDFAIIWPNSERTESSIDEIPRASIVFGDLTLATASSNESGEYRTIMLPVEDLYPPDVLIGLRDLTIRIINPRYWLIYFNSSIDMTIEGTGPYITVPPPGHENPVTVAYISNRTEPKNLGSGDAFYFPGLPNDVVDSIIEVWWDGGLLGRRFIT
jgi:hypothetical protein